MPLVGRVERDLNDLGVGGADRLDIAEHHLAALQQGRLGGVTGSLALENWSVFTGKENGAVAECGNATKALPGGVLLVVALSARLILGGVGLVDFVVEPHVRNGHSVLGKCTGLVRANGGGGAERLDGFQVLDQTVLFRHAFGGQGQAHGDGGEETFGDICDNDTLKLNLVKKIKINN